MSIDENFRIVKAFFAAMGGNGQDLLALLPRISNGSFPVTAGRWPAHTAGMPDWRIFFRSL